MTSESRPTFLHHLASVVGMVYLHVVGKTSIRRKEDHPAYLSYRREKRPCIYAFWHNNQVYLAYDHRGEKVNIMVSQSKDGEYIAQVMKRLGLNAVRGSSSKGGQKALREIIFKLKHGEQIGFTPDGPRGPVYSINPGVVAVAQLSGVPIVPTGVALSRQIVFRSWDGFKLPLPFGRIRVGHGMPLFIDREEDFDSAKSRVKSALEKVQHDIELSLTLGSWFEDFFGFVLARIYSLLGILLFPVWALMALLVYGPRRALSHVGERFQISVPAAEKRRLWFHAASVGEWQALRPLLKKFEEDQSVSLFVTVSTTDAEKMAKNQEPTVSVRMIPMDLPVLMDQFIKNLNPHALILIETELWPHMLESCYRRSIPVFVANGRMSPRSLKTWKIFRPLAARMMKHVSWFFVRSDQDARNFSALHAPALKLTVTGNVKSDSLKILTWDDKARKRKELFKSHDGLWVVAGSTWPGEEETVLPLLAQNFSKKIRLILAPRRVDRFGEVEKLLEKGPYTFSKWSTIKSFGEWTTDVLLVDTLGDLKDLYSVSDVAFIGGTLYPRGGQNPLEPASARVPVLFGPSMENFQEEAREFKKRGAARQVRHQADLFSDMREIIEDDSLRRSMGEAAAAVVASKQGAVDLTVRAIKNLLQLSS